MSHKKLRPFIDKVSVLGYFPLHGKEIKIKQMPIHLMNTLYEPVVI